MAGKRSSPKARFGALVGAAVVAACVFPAAASAAVTSAVDGAGVLTVSSDAADGIAISCVGGNVKINGADPGSGPADCTAITAIDVEGGPGANAINLGGVTVAAFPDAAPVTIVGGGGDDTIAGSEHVDTLRGGTGNDRISGDDNPLNTRDVFDGQSGNDTLIWNPGDDDDLMEGGAGADTITVNGGGGPEQFAVKPSATPGRVQFDRTGPTPPGPFNIDIGTAERLDLNANGGDDSVTADSGFSALRLDVDGGDGNDGLDGGDAADLLSGGNGDDRLVGDDNPAGTRDEATGGAGNDLMVWNPGDDDDVNEGGDGDDTSEVNGGGGDERFTVKPSPVAGRVLFDRTDPAPFNVDIGTTEHLRLNAAGGDDRIAGSRGLAGRILSTLNGDDGNDRIRGTDAADLLTGGKGHDLIRSRDKAADRVDCGSAFDLAFVDRRDRVRACEVVLGGLLRVKQLGAIAVNGDTAALKLRCVATRRCNGRVQLLRGGKSLGATKFRFERRQVKTFRIKLNRRGRAALARKPSMKATLRIDARDAAGNGWRTTSRVKLAR